MSQTDRAGDELGAGGVSTVLCGTFHRRPAELRATFDRLKASYAVLSPVSLDWVDPGAAFVRLPQEVSESAGEVEMRHLAGIRNADFVWLFCPDGYVGSSAAMEIGFAHAAGIPILTDSLPSDELLRTMVTFVPDGPEAALHHLDRDPGRPLGALQSYYGRAAQRRGWADESPRDTLLLLTEELGELARAVRHDLSLSRDGREFEGSAAEELADVQLYLVHLANALQIDLASAVTAKEEVNSRRAAKPERAA